MKLPDVKLPDLSHKVSLELYQYEKQKLDARIEELEQRIERLENLINKDE